MNKLYDELVKRLGNNKEIDIRIVSEITRCGMSAMNMKLSKYIEVMQKCQR